MHQRLHYLGIDLRRPESCAARPRGAHRPLWSHVAALGLSHSVMGAPPPQLLSRLEAFQRAPVLPVPRQRSTDAHEPCGMGSGRAAASAWRRGRLWWCTAAEPSRRRRHPRLCHAWRRLSARQRLHYLSRDLRRSESRAAWARSARWSQRGCAAALGLAHSITCAPPLTPLSRLAACLRALAHATPQL